MPRMAMSISTPMARIRRPNMTNTERSGPGPIPSSMDCGDQDNRATITPDQSTSGTLLAPVPPSMRIPSTASALPSSRMAVGSSVLARSRRRPGAFDGCCAGCDDRTDRDGGDPPLGSDQAGLAAIDPIVLRQFPERRRKARSERRPRRIGDPPPLAEGQDVVAVLVEQVGRIEQSSRRLWLRRAIRQ